MTEARLDEILAPGVAPDEVPELAPLLQARPLLAAFSTLFHGSEAEVLEFIVKPNAPATKAPIKELKLPQDTIIGGVVRGDKVFIAVGNMELSAYDRVVVFAMPASISKIGYFFN